VHGPSDEVLVDAQCEEATPDAYRPAFEADANSESNSRSTFRASADCFIPHHPPPKNRRDELAGITEVCQSVYSNLTG
jgi:hypothetical protein